MGFKFEMGDQVTDVVTGFSGAVVAATCYLTGCNRYGVSRGLDKDGKVADWQWFDENTLVINSKKKRIQLPGDVPASKIKGGPRPDAPQR